MSGSDGLSSHLKPFWTTALMEREPLFFIGSEDDARATLLFRPERIHTVTNAAGDLVYEELRDFVVDAESRTVRRLRGSRIPFTPREQLYVSAQSNLSSMRHRHHRDVCLVWAEDDTFHRRQMAVTYSHVANAGFEWQSRTTVGDLPHTRALLLQSKELTVSLMGDSIAEGYNASGYLGVAPFQPAFGPLVSSALERAYGSTIHFHNNAVSGSCSDDGIWNTDAVATLRPDLLLIAYGMNDAGYELGADFGRNIQEMIARVRGTSKATEFILVAPMLPHAEWDYPVMDRFDEYRAALAALCGSGVVIADITSVWSALLSRKTFYDLTGNGVNHPNDFGHRVYADTILASIEAALRSTESATGLI